MSVVHTNDPAEKLAHRQPVHVWPDTPLRSVAELLAREEIGAVLVYGDNGMVGVVSERDIVRAVAEGSDLDVDRAADAMTYDVARAAPDTSVRELAALMLEGEIRHLPVVEDDQTIGIVSMRDVLAVLAADDAALPS
jgi:CBS domain-containing protein